MKTLHVADPYLSRLLSYGLEAKGQKFTIESLDDIGKYIPGPVYPEAEAVFIDNGFPVLGIQAIMEYIEERWVVPNLWPADVQARALTRGLTFELCRWHPRATPDQLPIPPAGFLYDKTPQWVDLACISFGFIKESHPDYLRRVANSLGISL